MTIKQEAARDKKNLLTTLTTILKGSYGSNLTLLITLILMIVYFSLVAENFFQLDNMMNIARAVAITGVVAVGETIVLISGGIDLSITSVMAAAGMTAALTIRAGAPFVVGILVALLTGALIGVINGLIVTKIHINPFITTLGMAQIIRGFAYIISARYSSTLTVPVEGFSELGRGRLLGIIPYPVIVLIVVFIIAHFFLTKTLAGRYVYSIGGNPMACRYAGIDVDKWRLLFFAICSMMAGFGGYMLTSLVGSAIGNAALGNEMNVIAAVILGGASLAGGEGNIIGTFLGVFLLGTLTNGLIQLNVPSEWQMVAAGAVLMIALFIDSWRSGGYK